MQHVYSAAHSVSDRADISWTIPEEALPVFEVGVELAGTVYLDCLGWRDEPRYISTRPPGAAAVVRCGGARGLLRLTILWRCLG